MAATQADPIQEEKGNAFQALHQQADAFVIPNPWDAGSARLLAGMGFKALATTSSGFALTLGRADGQVSLNEKLEHCRTLCAATAIPISADLEDGYATSAEDVATTVAAAVETGLAGASVEDYDRTQIIDFTLAVERIQAAVEAVRDLSFPFLITARAENLLRGVDDLDDTIRRLQAFENAGAHVLYAPGLTTLEQVRTVTSAVSAPVNVLAPMVRGATVSDLAAAGARRISIGGALAFATISAMLDPSEAMLKGQFDWASATRGKEIFQFLKRAGNN